MTSDEIFAAIEEIAATPSKNAKTALVAKHIDDADFLRVLVAAYDPFKTYGLRKRPEGIGDHLGCGFDCATWMLLEELTSRDLTGNAAIEAVREEMSELSKESADLFWRIVTKDLRAGFSESTINKARKGTIKEFPYMRCSLPKDTNLAAWPWARGVFSQEKADGMFANVDHEANGLVSIRSRQGTEFPMDKFAEIAEEIRTRLTPGHQQHGEFLVLRDGKVCARQDGNGVMNHVLNGGDFSPNEQPVYMVWDQIPLKAVQPKGKCATPYRTRLAKLALQLKARHGTHVSLIPTKIVYSIGDAYMHAGEFMKAGKEGSVIKHPDATWRDSTSKEQIKIKLEFEMDLEIIAVVPGKEGGKNEGRAGSLTCRTSDGLLLVDVTVKNEAMRDDVDANPDNWINHITTVVANELMLPSNSNPSYSLFLPRMVEACVRKDKSCADSLERVIAQREAAIFGKSILKEAA